MSNYHSNEGDNGVHQNGIESLSSKGSNSSLDQSGGSSTSGQPLARGAHSASSSGKNSSKQTNGTTATTKKGKRVQGAGSAGKGSSQHHVAKQLLKNDSDDEATPISVSRDVCTCHLFDVFISAYIAAYDFA